MLHNNTNKTTLILVYAVLEWMLIILLLLNSVFSYFIIKFAQYFGLNPPCFSCARIGRFRYHLCDFHSKEVSQLRFCSNHHKLAEFRDMCENCSSPNLDLQKESRNFVFLKVERIDVIQGDGEGEGHLKCSCCGVNFERAFGDEPSCFVIHPLCDMLDNAQKVYPISDQIEKQVSDERIGSTYIQENQETESKEQRVVDEGKELEHEVEVTKELASIEGDLIQFELPHPKIEEYPNILDDEDHEFGDFQKAPMNSQEIVESLHQKTEESSELSEKILVSHENLIDFGDEKVDMKEETQTPLINTEELQEDDSDCKKPEGEEKTGDLKNLSIKVEKLEEEKAPDTPSGIYSPNPFHKKWLIPKTKDSGAEESFDGSVISEPDGGDPVNTAEKLKSALKAERKALRDLYAELEEERNASAVAANETMAMINRLQEEKASMQMEALQYQRMMEEQSEYDQEALQLLNEVMVKKENELELYRKKVSDYKAKEKMNARSISWSHSEDDEESSIDVYQVPEDENALNGDRDIQHQHTPVDSVLDMESVIANFEEERGSILGHLRFLEEKLVALSEEEDQHFANVRVIQDHYEEVNNLGFTGQLMTKQFFPLFEAISTETDDDEHTVRNGYNNGFHPLKVEDTALTRFELEKKRIDMEEEVDQLYRRLQALESDKEFLKHCIGSMKKGDKGMQVLQEILHYLRDLRAMNL